MPTVPVYGGPKVAPEPTPQPTVSSKLPEGALGGALPSVAGAVEGFAERAIAAADNLRISEEARALNDWEGSTLYDPKTGAKSMRGTASLSLLESVPRQFDDFANERRRALSSRPQQLAYDQMMAQRRAQVMGWVNDHVGRETARAGDEELEARGVSETRRAAQNKFMVPEVIDNLTKINDEKAARFGWKDNVKTAELSRSLAAMHQGVMDTLLASEEPGDKAAAGIYLSQYESQMDPLDAAKFKGTLREEVVRTGTKAEADRIKAQYSTRAERVAAARDVKGPPEYVDEVVRRVEADWATDQVSQHETDKLNSKTAYKIWQGDDPVGPQLPGGGGVKQLFNPRDVIPAYLWNALTPEVQEQFQGVYEDRFAVGQKASQDAELDKFLRLAEHPATREAFSRMDLWLFLHPLGEANFKLLTSYQEKILKGDLGDLPGRDEVTGIIDHTLRMAKIDPHPSDKTDKGKAEQVAMIRRKTDDYIAYRKREKMPTDHKVVQDYVDSLLIETSDKLRLGSLIPGAALPVDIAVGDIPESIRSTIEESRRSAGIDPTDALVEDVVLRGHGLTPLHSGIRYVPDRARQEIVDELQKSGEAVDPVNIRKKYAERLGAVRY